jgi:uncharacterized membrane protein YdjX (TVP38/TMEM64 family)
MTKARWLLLGAIAAAIALFFLLDLNRFLTVEQLQASRARLVEMRDAHPLVFSAAYFATYVTMATLSLPGAFVLTLAGGAVFGLVWGAVLVSFASSIGATTAMLSARFLFHDTVQARYGDKLRGFNAGFRKDGPWYLLTLRMTGVPYFLINLAMGLTPIRTWTFYWVSQLGMLPITVVIIYAGTQLGAFEISGKLIAAIAAVGVLPLVLKKVVEKLNSRRDKK